MPISSDAGAKIEKVALWCTRGRQGVPITAEVSQLPPIPREISLTGPFAEQHFEVFLAITSETQGVAQSFYMIWVAESLLYSSVPRSLGSADALRYSTQKTTLGQGALGGT